MEPRDQDFEQVPGAEGLPDDTRNGAIEVPDPVPAPEDDPAVTEEVPE